MVVAKGTLRKPPASSATSKDAGERFKRLESFATKRCSFSGARAEALRTWIAVGCSRCIVHSHRHPAAGWLPARLPSWRSGEGGGAPRNAEGRWRGLGRCRRHQFFGDKWHHDSAGMIVSKTPVIGIPPYVCNSPIAICTETRSICSVHITPACGRLLAGTQTL